MKTTTGTTEQHATSTRNSEQDAVPDKSAASGKTEEESLLIAPVKPPIRKRPRKGSPEKPPQEASASQAQLKHGKQQPADEVPPAERRRSGKKGREATPENLAGGRADGSNAGSMPGIPGSGADEMTWKQLDKRTDVKRGRFSEREKETLLQAVKVSSRMS